MQWNITDPDTNETIMVEGDTAPDENDAEEIFSQHRQALKSAEPQPTFLEKAGQVAGTVVKAATEPITGSLRNIVGGGQGILMGMEGSARAKGQTEKATQLESIRKVLEPIGITEEQFQAMSQKPGEAQKQIISQLGRVAQTATYAVPFGKGAGVIQKAAFPGAIVGGVQAGAEAAKAGDYGQILPEALKGAGTGALFSSAMYGAGEGIKALKGKPKIKLPPSEEERIAEQFKDVVSNQKPRSYSAKVLQNTYNATANEQKAIGMKPYYWEKLTKNGFSGKTPDQQAALSRGAIDIVSDTVADAAKVSPKVDGAKYIDLAEEVMKNSPEVANTKVGSNVMRMVKKIGTADLNSTAGVDELLQAQRTWQQLRANTDNQFLRKFYGDMGDAAQQVIYEAGEQSPAVADTIARLQSKPVQDALRGSGMNELADDIMNSVGIQDLRSTIAAFVKQLKMYDLLQAKGPLGGGVGRAVGRGMFGPLSEVVSPLISAGSTGTTAALTGKIANIIQAVGSTGPNAVRAIKTAIPNIDNKTIQQILGQLGSRAVAMPEQ